MKRKGLKGRPFFIGLRLSVSRQATPLFPRLLQFGSTEQCVHSWPTYSLNLLNCIWWPKPINLGVVVGCLFFRWLCVESGWAGLRIQILVLGGRAKKASQVAVQTGFLWDRVKWDPRRTPMPSADRRRKKEGKNEEKSSVATSKLNADGEKGSRRNSFYSVVRQVAKKNLNSEDPSLTLLSKTFIIYCCLY